MSKVRFKKYVHASKESNFELIEKYNDPDLKYVGCELEVLFEYDLKTKECTIIGCEGQFLGDEKYNVAGEAIDVY